MPTYRRWHIEGGTFFFTLVVHDRRPSLVTPLGRRALREAMARVRSQRPFEQLGVVLMPDHLHLLRRLPEGDSDFSSRIGAVKQCFTRLWLSGGGAEGPPTPGRVRQQYRGVWQKRFYEHWIRDYRDFKLHLDYVHANPVKHGLVSWPRDWPWSSFHRYVRRGEYDQDWCGHVELPGVDIEPDTW